MYQIQSRSDVGQIGFTVLSISLSLIAAFAPLLLMDGIPGRLLREFSLTLTFAIVISTVVSLTITPMICAHYIKETVSGDATWFDRLIEGSLSRMVSFYGRTLHSALGFPFLTLLVFFATIALTVTLYIKMPKGYFPMDDFGFVIGATRASADISFQSMLGLQRQLADIVWPIPRWRASARPLAAAARSAAAPTAAPCSSPEAAGGARRVNTTAGDRANAQGLSRVAGIQLFMFAASDVRAGGRQSDSEYQYTLSSTDLDLLQKWAPIVGKRHGDAWRASSTFPATAIPAACS